MEKISSELSRQARFTLGAIFNRLRDPSVIVLMILAFSSSHLLSLLPAPPSRVPQCRLVKLGNETVSRFLIPSYGMHGPMAFESLSERTRADFSLGGKTEVMPWLRRDEPLAPAVWSEDQIERLRSIAGKRDPSVGTKLCEHGEDCNRATFDALTAHPVRGMDVLIVGTFADPWLHATCLSFGANSTASVASPPAIVVHPQVRSLPAAELDASVELFDAIFSFTALAHEGLGRYGDRINPFADFERMKRFAGLLRTGGKLYLSEPNGVEFLLFNAHRVYGAVRFPKLIEGWTLLGTYGEDLSDTYRGVFKGKAVCFPQALSGMRGCFTQPVHVLTM